MNPAANRLIIHMGLHKTGTTSIQTFFSEFRDAISAAGLYYPESGCMRQEGAHHNIYRFYSQNADERSRFNPQIGGGAELISEIELLDKNVLLSSEGFWVLARDEPERFVEFVQGVRQNRKVLFLITWRNAAEYCESLYFQAAKTKQMVGIDTAVRWFFSMPNEFEKVVKFVSTEIDADTVIVQYGKDMIGIFTDLFAKSLKIDIDRNLVRRREENVSLSPAQKVIAAHLSLAKIRLEPKVYKEILDSFGEGTSDHASGEGKSIMPESIQEKLIRASVQGLRNIVENSRTVSLYPEHLPDQFKTRPCLMGDPGVFTFPKLRSALEAVQ